MSPYGKAVSAATKKKADAAKAKFMDGHDGHLQGAAQGQHRQGRHRRPATEEKQTDIALEKMDYLVEGVVGKTH